MNINKKLIIGVLVLILVILLIFTIYLLFIKPIMKGEISFNVPTKENFISDDFQPQPSLTIRNVNNLPSYLQSVITDIGYSELYQGLANLQGANDYIRYSGDDNGTLFTALYGDTSQYSTIEIVLGADNKPYPNMSINMPKYSLYNPNNDRNIMLNSSYAVGVYNKLNGTNYTGTNVIITKQTITTALTPTTASASANIANAAYNNQSSLTIKYVNNVNNLPSYLQSVITDIGYPWRYQGLANLQGNDYIRYCGNFKDGTLFTSLYGDTSQYSTIEIVLGANNKPYPNMSINMPKYSLYNPNNDRNIMLNSSYAVGVYNKLNGTNYTGTNVIITRQISVTIKYVNNVNNLPSRLQSVITDIGYSELYQGLVNLQVLNNLQDIASAQEINDYIRYCGNFNNGTLFTALYGDTSQYSTIEIVLGADNKPYPNMSINMPKYSLYNPNNDRNIMLNSSYAVGVYNKLNGTNYTGTNVIITKQTITTAPLTTAATTTIPITTLATTTVPITTEATTTIPITTPPITTLATTTTQVPTTTKFNCSFHMGNILNNIQENIQSCNSDSNCYYIGNNCLDYSNSKNIKNVNLTCSYTQQNPESNSSPYKLLFGCNNDNVDDTNYYIIKSIDYKDTHGQTQYLYQLSNDGDINSKSNIPFIYNGSLNNIDIITANTNNIDNINITDIKGNIKNFILTNNKERITTDIYIKPDTQAVGHMEGLGKEIHEQISVVAL